MSDDSYNEIAAKHVLLYTCAGGADVGEACERACRQLMSEGLGTVFCLAGVAAGLDAMVNKARDADLNLVIDGCQVDCARTIFTKLDLDNVQYLRATDMGLDKGPKGERATDEQVQTIVEHAREVLAGL